MKECCSESDCAGKLMIKSNTRWYKLVAAGRTHYSRVVYCKHFQNLTRKTAFAGKFTLKERKAHKSTSRSIKLNTMLLAVYETIYTKYLKCKNTNNTAGLVNNGFFPRGLWNHRPYPHKRCEIATAASHMSDSPWRQHRQTEVWPRDDSFPPPQQKVRRPLAAAGPFPLGFKLNFSDSIFSPEGDGRASAERPKGDGERCRCLGPEVRKV